MAQELVEIVLGRRFGGIEKHRNRHSIVPAHDFDAGRNGIACLTGRTVFAAK